MLLRRSIAASGLAHAGLLVWAFLGTFPQPTDTSSAERHFVEIAVGRSTSTQPGGSFADSRGTGAGAPETTSSPTEGSAGEDASEKEADEPEPSEAETSASAADPEPDDSTTETTDPAPEPRETSPPDEQPEDRASDPKSPDPEQTEPTDGEPETSDEKRVAEKSASPGSPQADSASGEDDAAAGGAGDGTRAGRAAGSGSGSGGGEGGGEGSSGDSGIDRGALIRRYSEKIYRRVRSHQTYPATARRQSIEGTVLVEVTVDEQGRILDTELYRSSGHDSLDRAALDALRSLDKLPPPPDALAWSRKALRIPIQYRLSRRG